MNNLENNEHSHSQTELLIEQFNNQLTIVTTKNQKISKKYFKGRTKNGVILKKNKCGKILSKEKRIIKYNCKETKNRDLSNFYIAFSKINLKKNNSLENELDSSQGNELDYDSDNDTDLSSDHDEIQDRYYNEALSQFKEKISDHQNNPEFKKN